VPSRRRTGSPIQRPPLVPTAASAGPWSGEISKPESVLSDQIKPNADEADQKAAKPTCQSDPPSLCYGAASQIKAEALSAAEEERGEAEAKSAVGKESGETRFSDQIKANGNSRSRKGKIAGGAGSALNTALREWGRGEPVGRMPTGAGWKPALPFHIREIRGNPSNSPRTLSLTTGKRPEQFQNSSFIISPSASGRSVL
jgi:hypothetical protein